MSAAFRRVFGKFRSKPNTQLTPSKLVVGLGNPGTGYSANRHNVGFMAVAHLAKSCGMHFDKKKGDARIAEGTIADTPVVLARPQTFMNASGRSVSALLRAFGLTAEDLIVVHDDLDLPTGRIRIRKGGSSGGHKGIQSIIDSIGSADFSRIRVGIGRPPSAEARAEHEKAVVGYVLSDFDRDERLIMDQVIPKVAEAVTCLLAEGIVAAMNTFNRQQPEKASSSDPK